MTPDDLLSIACGLALLALVILSLALVSDERIVKYWSITIWRRVSRWYINRDNDTKELIRRAVFFLYLQLLNVVWLIGFVENLSLMRKAVL